MTIFLAILGAILAIILDCIISEQFYRCAVAKGFEERKYFWYSFLFGLAGYLLVIALPDRGDEPVEGLRQPAPRAETPRLASTPSGGGTKTCPKCGKVQPASRARCINCGEILF